MKGKDITVSLSVILLSTVIGIGSRKFGNQLPEFLALYSGDTAWALAFFAFFRLLFNRLPLWEVFVLNLDFAFLIEMSQLWHPAWLENIRQTLPGALLLGFGFLGTDLICYFAGSALGFLIWLAFEKAINQHRKPGV